MEKEEESAGTKRDSQQHLGKHGKSRNETGRNADGGDDDTRGNRPPGPGYIAERRFPQHDDLQGKNNEKNSVKAILVVRKPCRRYKKKQNPGDKKRHTADHQNDYFKGKGGLPEQHATGPVCFSHSVSALSSYRSFLTGCGGAGVLPHGSLWQATRSGGFATSACLQQPVPLSPVRFYTGDAVLVGRDRRNLVLEPAPRTFRLHSRLDVCPCLAFTFLHACLCAKDRVGSGKADIFIVLTIAVHILLHGETGRTGPGL